MEHPPHPLLRAAPPLRPLPVKRGEGTIMPTRLAGTTSCCYCCALKSTAVRVTRRSTIITAPMITMTRPSGPRAVASIGFRVSKLRGPRSLLVHVRILGGAHDEAASHGHIHRHVGKSRGGAAGV